MVTCHEYNVPCTVCPTNTWRNTCGVKGRVRADKKKSMQMIVKNWYGINVSDDESDAIGIGYYMAKTVGKNIAVINWET